MSTKKLVTNQKGFTLVELMVVVAIIGILAAVAIPNFKKYQAKAKTGEATLMLATLYTGEQSMLMQHDTYVACVGMLGLDRPIKGYYITGWAAASNTGKSKLSTTCVDAGTASGFPTTINTKTTTALTDYTEVANTHSYITPHTINTVGETAVTVDNFSTSKLGIPGTGGTVDETNSNGTNSTMFVAVAAGSISTTTLVDVWSINEKKEVTPVSQGF